MSMVPMAKMVEAKGESPLDGDEDVDPFPFVWPLLWICEIG
jgi:hypothetical protein